MSLESLNQEVEQARVVRLVTPSIGREMLIKALTERAKYYRENQQSDLADKDIAEIATLSVPPSASERDEADDGEDFFESLDRHYPKAAASAAELDGPLPDMVQESSLEEDSLDEIDEVSGNVEMPKTRSKSPVKKQKKRSGKTSSFFILLLSLLLIASVIINGVLGVMLFLTKEDLQDMTNDYNTTYDDLQDMTDDYNTTYDDLQDMTDDYNTANEDLKAAETQIRGYQPVLSLLLSEGNLVYGPRDGSLSHDPDDGLISSSAAFVDLKNFVLKATFVTPYHARSHDWDMGFVFRYQGANYHRLVLESDDDLTLEYWEDDPSVVASVDVDNLLTREGSENSLALFVRDARCIVFLNGEVVMDVNQLDFQESGNIAIATGLIEGDEVSGEETLYKDFTIWSLDD